MKKRILKILKSKLFDAMNIAYVANIALMTLFCWILQEVIEARILMGRAIVVLSIVAISGYVWVFVTKMIPDMCNQWFVGWKQSKVKTD